MFIRRTHVFAPIFTIPIAVLLVALLLEPVLRSGTPLKESLFGITAVIFLTSLFNFCYGKCGLYIEDTRVYYRSFYKKQIDTAKIKTIKITHSVVKFNTEFIELKDKTGRSLNSMFLLLECEPWVNIGQDLNDFQFRVGFKDYIICSTIYDSSAVNYLLTLNPHIEILSLPSDLEQ